MHKCSNPCDLCHHIHADEIESWTYCKDSNRKLKNKTCFVKHKELTKHGNSTCHTHHKCTTCNQLINKKMHKKPHQCGERYCKTCTDLFEEGHKCYMLPNTTKEQIQPVKSTDHEFVQNESSIYFLTLSAHKMTS